MLDINLIREKPKDIQNAALAKGVTISIELILKLDAQVQSLQREVQHIREERNTFVKSIFGKPSSEQIEKGKKVKEELDKKEEAFRIVSTELQTILVGIPNPAKLDVKVGKDDSENEVVKKVSEPMKFSFKPKDHLELGELLDIIDVKQAALVSGTRFYYLKNEGVLLEFALKQFAFEILIKEGFIPILPPVLVKKDIMDGLGYTQMGEAENIFSIENGDLYLVGTAEQSIVPYHMNDVLKKEDLPRRYVGFSTAFRREAGSYGKDTRGIFRVHQFDKSEMVSFVAEGEDDKEHEYMLSLEERFMQQLSIPYQVVKVCTGDLGFNAARKYDIEAWIPTQNKYREMTSTSNVTDFQSRRLNMRYQEGEQRKYLQILNGTVFSTRPLVAIIENYQQEDGSIVIPEVLQKYIGKDKIIAKSSKNK
ncbi:MAG TPA: serine--tRNA ligase [Candidatus Sulfotelmatobacter sp.]|jgi:seryl-tRNA synthetase|nr:serine--tRNA ligase [Candidatus Sulfotelmatobacter sp.]